MKLHKIPKPQAIRYYKIHTFNAVVCLAMIFFASTYAWRVTFLIVFVIEILVLLMIKSDLQEDTE